MRITKEIYGDVLFHLLLPLSAITMKPDVMGFMYPVVDMDKCVNCGLCEKVCAFSDNYKTPDNFDKPKPFAARQLNIQET